MTTSIWMNTITTNVEGKTPKYKHKQMIISSHSAEINEYEFCNNTINQIVFLEDMSENQIQLIPNEKSVSNI